MNNNFLSPKMNWTTAEEAVRAIPESGKILIQGAAATPQRLIDALVAESDRLKNIEIFHLHTNGSCLYAQKQYRHRFKVVAFFVGANLREHFSPPYVDYMPCSLSEIPLLLRSQKLKIDVALIHVSPPDRHGYCSLGTSVDIIPAGLQSARLIIAQVNPNMPRVHGDGFIHSSRIDYAVKVEDDLPEVLSSTATKEETLIGKYVANLVEDGSTLQMGIGSIPDAALQQLMDRRHLGIHTEMWSDGALRLIKCGAVDNSRKIVHPGKTVSSFLMGSKELYQFVNDNQTTIQLEASYINNPLNIARNPKVVTINSAVEIDLTGQICADSIGPHIISGTGGQMDFMRGAALSPGGKPIIAMTSRTRKGISRIVSRLRLGAGVVTPRAFVHYVITEYGCVNLYGKTLSERAKSLINLAHPDDRATLERDWWETCQRFEKH